MVSPAGVSGSEAFGGIWKVHGVLVLVQCLIGGAYVLDKVVLDIGVNPIVYAVYRDIVGLCVLIPVAYFTERVFASQLLMLFGIQLATATLASISTISIPVCVFLFSAVFGIEEIYWRRFDGQAKVGGIISAVVGAVRKAQYKGPAILGALSAGVHSRPASELLLDGNGISSFTELHLSTETWQIGIILLFLGGVCLSIYYTIQDSQKSLIRQGVDAVGNLFRFQFLKRFPALVSMAAFARLFGGIAITMAGLATVQDRSKWVIHERSAIISIVYAGVVSAPNFALQAWSVQRAGPVLVASYIPLHVFVTSFLALIFIGGSLHLGSVLGTLLVINGLYFITLGKLEGRKLAAREAEAVPSAVLPSVNAVSNLEEPQLQ